MEKHPRFHIHFVPTGSSWLNMVERYFRDIMENHIRRGVFRIVDERQCTILETIDQHSEAPRPYIWTAKAMGHREGPPARVGLPVDLRSRGWSSANQQ